MDEYAEIARKSFVSSRASQSDAKENMSVHHDSFRANVVRISNCANESAAIKSDVELARQIVERTVVNNDLCEVLAERKNIDEFVRINACGRIGSKIADVVRSR